MKWFLWNFNSQPQLKLELLKTSKHSNRKLHYLMTYSNNTCMISLLALNPLFSLTKIHTCLTAVTQRNALLKTEGGFRWREQETHVRKWTWPSLWKSELHCWNHDTWLRQWCGRSPAGERGPANRGEGQTVHEEVSILPVSTQGVTFQTPVTPRRFINGDRSLLRD